ncbi:MAG: hypothetical protein KBD78_02650 [Oligoflexales bacterium]|nr:hypothetical protein [Oligoflexales bacterium]
MLSLPNDAAFRQRKSYWKKKGMSEDEAIQRALSRQTSRAKLSLVPKESIQAFESQPLPEQPSVNEIAASKQPKTEKLSFKNMLIVVISLAFIVTCSALLISATSKALGNSPTAWSQAALLEIGALTLAVIKPHSWFENLTFKLTSVFLIGLTLFVLHNSNLTHVTSGLRQEDAINQKLANLTEIKNLTVNNISALQHIQVTKRQQLISQLERINADISQNLTSFSTSQSQVLVSRVGHADFLLRVSLLLLNILFGRLLLSRLTSVQKRTEVAA